MEKKQNESSSQPITMEKDVCVPTTSKDLTIMDMQIKMVHTLLQK